MRASAAPICRNCGRDVIRETAEVVAAELGELPAGTRLLIGFDMPVVTTSALPLDRDAAPKAEDEDDDETRPGDDETRRSRPCPDCVDPVAETLAALRRKGFGRLYVDGADGRRSRTSIRRRSRIGRSCRSSSIG